MENAPPLGDWVLSSSYGQLEQQENVEPSARLKPATAVGVPLGLHSSSNGAFAAAGLKRAGSASLQGDSSKPRIAFSDITNQTLGRSADDAKAQASRSWGGQTLVCLALPSKHAPFPSCTRASITMCYTRIAGVQAHGKQLEHSLLLIPTAGEPIILICLPAAAVARAAAVQRSHIH